jgi:hypothetical protein
VLSELADELDGYDWSKDTLRFLIDQRLPRQLTARLVEVTWLAPHRAELRRRNRRTGHRPRAVALTACQASGRTYLQIAITWAAPASTTITWNTSWKPNHAGHGSGRRRA